MSSDQNKQNQSKDSESGTIPQLQEKRIAYIIGNFRYPSFTGLDNLPWVEQDAALMKKFLDYNKFQTALVYNTSKFSFGQMEKQMITQARQAQVKKQNLTIFLYYGGFSNYSKGQTSAVTFDNKGFDLINLLNTIVSYSNTQFIGFFDCCQANVQDIKLSQQLMKTKGSFHVIHSILPKIDPDSEQQFNSAANKFLNYASKQYEQQSFRYLMYDFVCSQQNDFDTYACLLSKSGMYSFDSFKLNLPKKPTDTEINLKDQFQSENKEPTEELNNDISLYIDEDVLERVIRYNDGTYDEQIEQINILQLILQDPHSSEQLKQTVECWIGWCHLYPLGNFKEDEKKAVEIFKSYEQNSFALFCLALAYHQGYGELDKNDETAFFYATKSSFKGDRRGIGLLGYMNHCACGVPQNMMQALILYEKSAELGNANAMYNLGISYYNGDGVKQDKEKAIEYYKMAAEKKYDNAVKALNELGIDLTPLKEDETISEESEIESKEELKPKKQTSQQTKKNSTGSVNQKKNSISNSNNNNKIGVRQQAQSGATKLGQNKIVGNKQVQNQRKKSIQVMQSISAVYQREQQQNNNNKISLKKNNSQQQQASAVSSKKK